MTKIVTPTFLYDNFVIPKGGKIYEALQCMLFVEFQTRSVGVHPRILCYGDTYYGKAIMYC